MRRFCLIALVAALAVAATAVLAVPAGAKPANSKVSVGVGFVPQVGDPFFQGTVKSGRKSCKVNRVVAIFFQRNRGKKRFFRRSVSDSSGYYKVPMNDTMRTGAYYARVKAKTGCKKDSSRTIAVGQSGPGGLG